jgi:hypothetical protein
MAKTPHASVSSNSLIDEPLPLVGLAVSTMVAVPWYWHLLGAEISGRVVYGLPRWAFVSILGSFAVSCFTWRLYQNIWPAEAIELQGDSDPQSDDPQSDDPQSDDPQSEDLKSGDPQSDDRLGEVE